MQVTYYFLDILLQSWACLQCNSSFKLIDLIQTLFGASLAKVVTYHEAKVERKEKYLRSDFLCPVLRLGKQVYQIRYFFTLSDQQPGSREAAGRGEVDVRHSASTRCGGFEPHSTSFKHRWALSSGTGRPTRPSLPSQLFPDCPLEGAGAGESSWIQGTSEPFHSPNTAC